MASLSAQHSFDHAGVKFPPPLFFAAFFAGGWLLQRLVPLPRLPAPLGPVGGAAFVAAGLVLNFWSIGLFWRSHTSLVPIKPSTALVIAGPYRFTRNPMYLALVLVYVGAAMWTNVMWALILLPVVVVGMQSLVIHKEE